MHRDRVARVLLTFILAIWLIGISFSVVLLPPVTHALADATVDDQLGGFTHQELVHVADEGLIYVLIGGGELPVGADERTAITPDALSHLDDVRIVLQSALLVTLILTLIVILVIIILRKRGMKAKDFAPVLVTAGVAPLACVVVLGVIGIVSFDVLFTGMHQIFFADGTWTFSYNSLLIRAYPIAFWMGMGIVWAVALVIVCVLTLVVGLKLRKP
jgi:integral membrane protein (TIGR01906 family)